MLNKKLSLLILPFVATLSLQANDPFFNDPFGDDIFKEMMQMQQNMDKMFNRMNQRMQQRSTRLVSPLGTYKLASTHQFMDKGDHYELETTIPENKENQIDITINKGLLSISAKIIEKHENKTANGYSSSSSMRMYQQSMAVPSDADENSVSATYKNKKLVISIDKKKNSTNTAHITIHKANTKTDKKELNTTKESNATSEKSEENNRTKINSDMPSVS